MLIDWDKWVLEHSTTDVLRQRVWAGVPYALRARVWPLLTGQREYREKNVETAFQELVGRTDDTVACRQIQLDLSKPPP